MQVGELVAELRIDDQGFAASIARAGQAFRGLAGEAAADGRLVGSNFSRGLAGGISAGTGFIQAAARAAARAARAAAESELQVHSPSRVGAGIGKNFALGMAEGIAEMAGSVSGAAKSLARAAGAGAMVAPAAAAPAAASGAAQAAGVDYELILRLAAQRQTVLQMDGKTLARAAAADNNLAVGAFGRSVALGYGG